MKNQKPPIRLPAGICANTTGSVLKPRPNVPVCTAAIVPDAPKNTNAAGIVIKPPKPTSNSSLVADAVRPETMTSSFLFM